MKVLLRLNVLGRHAHLVLRDKHRCVALQGLQLLGRRAPCLLRAASACLRLHQFPLKRSVLLSQCLKRTHSCLREDSGWNVSGDADTPGFRHMVIFLRGRGRRAAYLELNNCAVRHVGRADCLIVPPSPRS